MSVTVFRLHDFDLPYALPLVVRRMTNQTQTHLHEHVYHEIVYIESGTGEHLTVDGRRRLQAGDLIVMRPRMWHQYLNPQGLRLVNCVFAGSLLRRGGEAFAQSPAVFSLFQRRIPAPRTAPPVVMRTPPRERPHLAQCLDRMMHELAHRPAEWEPAVMAWFMSFLVSIARQGSSGAPAEVTLSDRVRKAVLEVGAHLEGHYPTTPSLADLAAKVHLSPAYLCRAFTRQMGMSIVTYLHHVRMEEACRLLRQTGRSITDVAGQVGYNEIAYFSRRFRSEVGLSPRQYRATKTTGIEPG